MASLFLLKRNSDRLVISSLPDRLSSKLRLRRLVTRRNEAVLRYRKLVKASVAIKSDELERAISEQLATIEQLNAAVERLQGKQSSRARGNVVKANPKVAKQIEPRSKEPD
jgi:hypothetical protein